VSLQEKQEFREAKLPPLMEEFLDWASQVTILQGSKLGKAINYALNHKENLMHVLMDERCALSNNLAERSIRPLTIGRKNFSYSQLA
jgi:transposase